MYNNSNRIFIFVSGMFENWETPVCSDPSTKELSTDFLQFLLILWDRIWNAPPRIGRLYVSMPIKFDDYFPLKRFQWKKKKRKKIKKKNIETALQDFKGILLQFLRNHKWRIGIPWNVKSISWPKVIDMSCGDNYYLFKAQSCYISSGESKVM